MVLGSFAILFAGSVILALMMRHLDIQEYDHALETKARTLATLVLREGRAIEVDFAGEYMPEFESVQDTEYFQFRLVDGMVIERSDMLGESDLPFLPEALEAPIFRNLPLPDGRRGRFVQIAFPPRLGEVEPADQSNPRFHLPETSDPDRALVVLTLARSREDLDAMLAKVYLILAGINILLAGLVVLAVRTALGRGFQPLVGLNQQIERLGPGNLEQRIHLPDAPCEIASLPATMNLLLERLQDSFVRERRFTSDAAHELRTPVAEFRAACEVGAKWSDDPALVRRRFHNLQQSAQNMERLLNGLLDLSRLDSGRVEAHSARVNLAALLDSCWARVRAEEPETSTRLENGIATNETVAADPVKLEMIVLNLLANAACHSVPDSEITCTGQRLPDGQYELCIRNHAQNLAPDDMPHLFERFWRKDAARTGGRHSGLGLSIVQGLADILGIRLIVTLTPGNVFCAALLFPAPPPR